MRLQVGETLGILVGQDNAAVKLIYAEDVDFGFKQSSQANRVQKEDEGEVRGCTSLQRPQFGRVR